MMGNSCDHYSAFIFDWIFLILVGQEDNNKSLDELKYRPDPTSDCGISRPVTFVRSCSTGHSGAYLVSDRAFSLVGLVSVYYMLIDAGSVAALTFSQFGSLVPLLEGDVCLCS